MLPRIEKVGASCVSVYGLASRLNALIVILNAAFSMKFPPLCAAAIAGRKKDEADSRAFPEECDKYPKRL
jgi:hypothetical protein